MWAALITKPEVLNESLEYKAPLTLSTIHGTSTLNSCSARSIPFVNSHSPTGHPPNLPEDCPICLEQLTGAYVQIKGCGHCFHDNCIKDCLTSDPKCPVCRQYVREPQGTCPSGTMQIQQIHEICPGFESSTRSLKIDYSIPEGKQASYHDNPGKKYSGTTRTAFLPNNDDGRQLLTRLKYAWIHGMTFTIGTSLTTGQSDSVVWTSIHHKTSLHGGSYGFPDPSYISRCNQDLTALGVPPADANPVSVRNETLRYVAPVTLSQTSSIADALVMIRTTSVDEFQATPSAPSWILDHCAVGLTFDELQNTTLQGCSRSKTYKAPEDVTEPQGLSPSGTMMIKLSTAMCPGFSTRAIKIQYHIPEGNQLAYHPNPGVRYGSTTRRAYLPHNLAGCQLLARLKYAWMHGLTFSIGTSLTTGKRDCVVWSSINHKTSLEGGPYGFPDRTYVAQCNESLDALGVPSAEACLHN